MPEVSATEAARKFSELLDAVEHRGERYTIVRRGKVIAQLDPVVTGRGSEVKALLRANPVDAGFSHDIERTRSLLEIETRD